MPIQTWFYAETATQGHLAENTGRMWLSEIQSVSSGYNGKETKLPEASQQQQQKRMNRGLTHTPRI